MKKCLLCALCLAFVGVSLSARPFSAEEEGANLEALTNDEAHGPLRNMLEDPPVYPPPYPPPARVPTVNVTDDEPLGGDDNTAQSVVSRSKLTLPETDNKGQAAENFISLVGNNGIIEKRKLDNTLQTLSRSYDLAEAMLIDALTGAPLSTAGRIRFTVDANNDIDIEMTLFYPNSVSEAERQADAEAGTDRVRQLSDEGTYTQALRNAGNEAGFDGDAVTLAEFEVESPGEGAASALKAGLIGACASVVMLLFLA